MKHIACLLVLLAAAGVAHAFGFEDVSKRVSRIVLEHL